MDDAGTPPPPQHTPRETSSAPPADRRRLERFSVVIPAHDEEHHLASTVRHLHETLVAADVPHEIVVVDDGSTDATPTVLAGLAEEIPEVVPVRNDGPHGYGRAVVAGLDVFTGDAVCVMMADESDSPDDAVLYWETLQRGWDCVFGSRFVEGSRVDGYPWFKLAINRLANQVIRRVFHIRCNDVTNAFKAYRREVVAGCRPFLSPHFNLTIEIPLKAVVRGYTWTVVPISWRNREAGESKLRLKEMGSRYFFIMMYCWLEKRFSRGDYRRTDEPVAPRPPEAGRGAVPHEEEPT